MAKALYTVPSISHAMRYHLPILEQLQKRGYEVTLAVGRGASDSAIEHVEHIFPEPGLSPENEGADVSHLASLIANEGFDIVAGNTRASSQFTCRAVKASHFTPQLTSVMSFGFGYDDDTARVKRAARRAPLIRHRDNVDLLMVMNDEDLASAQSHGLARVVRKIPGTGVDLSELSPVTAERRAEARAELGCAESDFVVVGTGAFDKNHRQRFIIDNMQFLPRNIRLFLLGEGEKLGDCRARATVAGVEDNVLMPGRVDDLRVYLDAADAMLSACRYEGFPRAIVEGQALGLPAIVSAAQGNLEVVENGVNGFVYSIEEPDSFVAAVQTLYGDERVRKAFSQKALENAQHYELSHAVGAIMSSFDDALYS